MIKQLYIPLDTTIDNMVECEKLIKRGDILTLTIKVFNNGILANLSEQSIDLILHKNDGTLIENTIDSSNILNGVITATLSQQATLTQGLVSGELQIYTNNTLTSTNTFTFTVSASLANNILEISKNDIQVLSELRELINDGQIILDKYEDCILAIGNTVEAIEALVNIKSYIDTNLPALQNENAEAVVNIQALKTENDKSPTLTGNLKSENDKAINNISVLTTKNAEAIANKNNLDNSNTSANSTKNALDTLNTTANTTKEALNTSVLNANTSKSALDASKTNADNSKVALDNSIDEANQFVQNHQDIENLVDQVNQNTTQLSEKANQSALDATNANVTSNTNAIATNTDKISLKADKSYVDTKIGNIGNTKTFKGSCTYAELTSKTGMLVDDYWYITDSDKLTNYCYNGVSWVDIGNNLKIGDNTITPTKLAFKKTNYNLFDYTKLTYGKVMNTDGTISVNASFDMSDYIQVDSSTSYYFEKAFRIIELDVNKVVVTYSTDAGSSGQTLTTSATTKWVVVNFATGLLLDYTNIYVCKNIYKNFCMFDEKSPFILNESQLKISDKISYLRNTSAFEKTVNLFDKEQAHEGYGVGGTGIYYTLVGYNASGLIPVSAGVSYTATSISRICFFDANYNFLSYVNNVTNFTTPANTSYLISHTTESIDTFMISETSKLSSSYIPAYKLKSNLRDINNWFYGKKILTIGDSITNQNYWQPYVVNALKFKTHYKHGYSGYRTYQLAESAVIDTLESDPDVIIIMTGMNDWANNIAIGSITDEANVTFCGNVYTLLTTLITKYPNKQIIYLTTTYGMLPSAGGFTDGGRLNTLGLSTLDYGNAILGVCSKLNIPCIEVGRLCGWNKFNIATYVQNDGGYLHPNDTGGKRLASVVVGGLKALEPIS